MSAAPSPPRPRERSSFERWRAAVAVCDREQLRVLELKSARLYAFGVFLSYAALIWIVRGREQSDVLGALTHDALKALTFVVGTLAALGAARSFAQTETWQPFAALAAQRGYDSRTLHSARWIACAARVALLVGVPSIALVAVAGACGMRLGWALCTGAALGVYALGLGLFVAALAWLAARLAPRHARSSLLFLGLGPLVVALGFPGLPSVPSILSWALARIAELGAHFT